MLRRPPKIRRNSIKETNVNGDSGVNLRIPGPVPLPDDVLELAGSQMINHRGPEYAEMLDRMTANLKTVFGAAGDVYFITSSGTGAMETAVVNTLSPGDEVLSLVIGVFGKRFAEIAEAYGANVTRLEFPLGQPADPDEVAKALAGMTGCKAVLFTHNESSTGTTNPLEEIAATVHGNSDALVLVDAVSSAGGVQISVDAWGIDVVATASQKSWVSPPGIAMVSFSDKAWKAYETSGMPKYYLDVAQYRDYLEIGQPPFTPCLPAMYTLDRTLERMIGEGVEEVFARHQMVAEKTRRGAQALGLEILPEERFSSATVTAVKVPDDVDGKELVARVRRDHGIVLGGGQQELTGKIFRIGHMGWVDWADIDDALDAVGKTIGAMRT